MMRMMFSHDLCWVLLFLRNICASDAWERGVGACLNCFMRQILARWLYILYIIP